MATPLAVRVSMQRMSSVSSKGLSRAGSARPDITRKPQGLTDEDVETLREQYGYNEVLSKKVPEWVKVMKRYIGIVPVLLIVAAVVAAAVPEEGKRDWMSFALLLFLVNLMVWADYLSDRRAASAVDAVQSLSAPSCKCRRNGELIELKVRELVPGDVCLLKAGVVIPADGEIKGDCDPMSIDESSLTGESLAVTKCSGDEVLSGAIVMRGEAEIYVTRTGPDSFFGKTIALLNRAEGPGHLRRVLNIAAKIITGVGACFCLFLLFWLIFYDHYNFWVALKISLVILASVAPAAMPVVTTTVLAVGSMSMAAEKAVVTRLSAIEEAAGMQVLCSDKTGTLTKNELDIRDDEVACEPGVGVSKLFLYASLACSMDDPEPIDFTINNKADMIEREKYKIRRYVPFNPVDKRASAYVTTPENERLIVVKGAPHVIRDMVTADNPAEYQRIDKLINAKASKGLRTLGVAITDDIGEDPGPDAKWTLLGYVSLFDPPRDDTAETIYKANEMGIEVKMITGDQLAIAIDTARQLGLGTNMIGPEIWQLPHEGPFGNCKNFSEFCMSMNGFAGVYPEHKFRVVEAILETKILVGMTGDGVNDAPALNLATVGIAVAGATDAAKSASDITLLEPGLSTIITAFRLSRKIFRRIEAYILFRIYTSMLILGFFFFAIVCLRFRFPSWVLVLISMINDFTLLSSARDRVPCAPVPQIWNMLRIAVIASSMAVAGIVAAVLYLALIDPTVIGWWGSWNLAEFPYPAASYQNAALWLLITLLIQFPYHSARSRSFWFVYDGRSARGPALIVLTLQLLSILLTLFLTVYWPYDYALGPGAMSGLGWRYAGVTIFWGFIWFLVVDISKVIGYKLWGMSFTHFSLAELFDWRMPDEIEAEKKAELNRLRVQEQQRRFDEGTITVDQMVESRQDEIVRRITSMTIPQTQSRLGMGVVGRMASRSFSSRPSMVDDGMGVETRVSHLEGSMANLESKMDQLIDVVSKQSGIPK